jgi:sugar phosphate permease
VDIIRRVAGRPATVAATQSARALSRYRWLVLAAGTAAQTSFSAVIVGLPVLAPTLRDAHSLSLLQVGVLLDSLWIGTLLTLLPWGVLADRIGERLVLATGLVACGAALVGAGQASGFGPLIVLIGLAGAAGASVNAASGRAVMQWFPAAERGFALGVRQTAIPVGGLISALALPVLSLRAAFVFLAGLCVAGAAFGLAAIRERVAEDDVLEPRGLGATLRDDRLWLLCAGSSLYLVAQLAITGFLVLFLHDKRGLSVAAAAGVLAGVQVVAAAMRIGGGRWSDRLGSRLRPLRMVGIGSALTLGVATALLSAPLAVLVAAFVLAGGLSMAWNGLSFTAAAEIAGRSRSGAALGMQQTALAAAGAVVPPAFAAVVAASSWRVGFAVAAVFPLAGVQLLRPLRA